MSQNPPDKQSSQRKSMQGGIYAGIGLTIPAVLLAIYSGGMGHRDYFFARLLFPYPMLLTKLTDNTISALSIIPALVQLPIEGALIALGIEQGHRSPRMLIAFTIVAAHLLAFFACSSLRSFT